MTPTDAVEVKLAALQITQAEEDMATSRLERRPSLCKQILHVKIVVSTDDVDKLYHHFLRIDEDGNGVIDRDELLRIPSVAGNPLASRLLELFDTDDSGDINFGEFVAGLSIFSAKSSSEKKYKYGYISNGELFIVLRMMTGDHLKPVQLQQIVDKTIRDADTDGDGRLSFEEFRKVVENSNGDFVSRWAVADL